MAIQITRAEYEKKFGILPTSVKPSIEIAQPQGNTGVKGLATGVAKSGVGLFQGIGQIGRDVQKGISKGIEKVTGKEGFGVGESMFDEDTESGQKLTQLATPRTTSEKIGKFAGDVAQFAIPATGAVKATKGAGVVSKIGAQAGSDALVQSAQQGGFDRNTVDTAILGAVFPGLGALKQGVKIKIGPKTGGRVINSLVKPLLKDFSYGKDPGMEVAKSGITANSLDELTDKIRLKRQEIGDSIGTVLEKSKVMFDAKDAFTPIDNAIQEAMRAPRTNAQIINRLKALKDDIFGIADFEGQEIATRKLDQLSAKELFELKREVGDLTRWTGNASDDEIVNKALKQTYGAIKSKLDEKIPAIKGLNERYANLKSAETATEYRDKIAARQNMIGFNPRVTGAGFGVATALMTGAITPAVVIGLGAAGLEKALATPAAKTRLASWLAKTPKEELQSTFKQAPWLRSALQSAFFGEEDAENSGKTEEDNGTQ